MVKISSYALLSRRKLTSQNSKEIEVEQGGQYDNKLCSSNRRSLCVGSVRTEATSIFGEIICFLFDQLQSKGIDAIVRGYSIYEVDGAFVSLPQGQTPKIYDEKTLVVRLIYDLPDSEIETRIYELAREVIAVTQSQEEEIWILRSQATQFRFIKEESP